MHNWTPEQASFVVVLAHGYGEHAGRYDHVAQALIERGGIVHAPDQWGHGLSEGTPGLADDIEVLAADLAAVADHARAAHPDLPVVVIGHSLGGMVATRFVQQHPDGIAALVLSGPLIGGNSAVTALLELPEIPDIPIDPGMLSRDPAVGEAYAADDLVYHGPLLRGTLEGIREAVDRIATGGSLGDLPTLWIHGELDPLAPLAETRAAVEIIVGNALRSVIYPGAMHEVFNETNKDEVIAEVVGFIDDVLVSREISRR